MDILSHPERLNTASENLPRAELRDGCVHCSSDGERGSWTAIGKFCDGHGWDIDVRRNGKLVAMRVAAAAWIGREGGMDLVSDTLNDVMDGRIVGGTFYL